MTYFRRDPSLEVDLLLNTLIEPPQCFFLGDFHSVAKGVVLRAFKISQASLDVTVH